MSEHITPKPQPKGYVVLQRYSTKLAFWLFLGGEVVFFTTLLMTFVYFRITHAADYAAFKQHLSIPLVGLNTFILITSSYLVVRALDALQNDRHKAFSFNLLGVIILGLVFLGGQAFEWVTLFNEGIGVQDLFGTPFFSITGVHGTHVLVGVLWAIVLWAIRRRGTYSAVRISPVEMFGLYWHFVDIVWIVLFTLFYLI